MNDWDTLVVALIITATALTLYLFLVVMPATKCKKSEKYSKDIKTMVENASIRVGDAFLTNFFNNFIVKRVLKPIAINDSIEVTVLGGSLQITTGLLTISGDAGVKLKHNDTVYPLTTSFVFTTGITVPGTVLGYMTGITLNVQSLSLQIDAIKSNLQEALVKILQGVLNAAVWTVLEFKSNFTVALLDILGLPKTIGIQNLTIKLNQGEVAVGLDDIVDVKSDVGLKCEKDGDCAQGCGYKNADAPEKTCCPSGSETYYGTSYCHNLPNGERCYANAVCSSNYCKGNMYGVKKGECAESS